MKGSLLANCCFERSLDYCILHYGSASLFFRYFQMLQLEICLLLGLRLNGRWNHQFRGHQALVVLWIFQIVLQRTVFQLLSNLLEVRKYIFRSSCSLVSWLLLLRLTERGCPSCLGFRDSLDDKSKANGVQIKGRFSVTSENLDLAKVCISFPAIHILLYLTVCCSLCVINVD